MSISQVTWPTFGQLDISNENRDPRLLVRGEVHLFTPSRPSRPRRSAQETLTQLLAIACPTGEPLQATEKVLQIMALTQSALPVDTMTRLLDWLES
jgi:hypothetical protein